MLRIADALQAYGEPDSLERREVGWLLEHIVGINALTLKYKAEQLLSNAQEQQFVQCLARLKAGEPLAYVLGEQDFWTLTLTVTPDTLIPRPDTEILVAQALARIATDTASHVLDLGTGSGAVGLSIAKERPLVQMLAIDYSAAALAVAQRNAQRNQVHNIAFAHGSWFDALTTLDSPPLFDVIVSNPPYIDAADPHMLQLGHEPLSALVAANHGLADIQHIIAQAAHWLTATGYLLLEHGCDQGCAVRELLLAAGFKQVATVQDYGGNDRVSLGCCA